jgi:hypothetical protein
MACRAVARCGRDRATQPPFGSLAHITSAQLKEYPALVILN